MKKSMIAIAIVAMFLISCGKKETSDAQNTSEKVTITVFHAGSLAKPFKDVKAAFEAKYPNTQILLEAAGSRACARKITDLKKNAEVLASADEVVITSLMFPEYADYCLNFVTNEMVIIYKDDSKYSEEINSENWYQILLTEGVEYGHSEPEKDPCGYRTILTWQLAEKYYQKPGLYKLLQDARPLKNIRAKEVDLLALIDAGELDYLFIYKSVAEQHNYKYVQLPPEINLGSASLNDYYATASIELTGKKPGEVQTVTGAAMVYGITVPKTAEKPEWGIKFVDFVISAEGQKIMQKNGHPVIDPAQSAQYDKLPEELKKSAVPL
jgi:molybdate/tungstate transport system substrate-binding protein